MSKKLNGKKAPGEVSGLKKSIADLQQQLAEMKTAAAIQPPRQRELYAGVPQQFADQGRRQVEAVIAGLTKDSDKRAVADLLTETVGEPIAALMLTAHQQAARANAVEEVLVTLVDAVGHWPMSNPDVSNLAGVYLQIRDRVAMRRKQAAAAKDAEVASASNDDNGVTHG